jgi:O-antigen biosynthesis protein
VSASREEAASGRLIEWTGERCVPWVKDAAMLYEHLHRYLWAARLTAGRRVLDLGCGEGYGAAILAGSAVAVVGVDVDERTVAHARANYAREGLRFEQASALDLSAFDDASFDAVVAFEMIEHVSDHERLMAEISRVLGDDGLLVVSTPDKDVYSQATGQVNDFHEHELTLEQFRDVLAARYAHVAMWGQRTITGSYLSALGDGERDSSVDFFVGPERGTLTPIEEPVPLFCVALASNAPLPPAGRSSTLSDYSLELLHQTARAHAVAVEERDGLLAQANENIREAHEELDQKRQEVLAVGEQLRTMRDELWIAEEFRSRVERSTSWQALQRGRTVLYGAIGESSVAGRAIKALLRLVGRFVVKS